MNSQFKGVITALVTPFLNNEVDYPSLEKLVKHQLDNGIQGFVVNGTTAESPTLTESEVLKIYSSVRTLAGSKFPIILGTGSNSTANTIVATKKAEELGANAALVVVPYYNKPPQRGLVEHFKAVARGSSLPIILYNVPGRTITSMTPETIQTLSEVKNIIGIKEATGDIAFDQSVLAKLKSDFIFLSGDDPTFVDFLKIGGHGIISVMSNLITKECAEWQSMGTSGQFAKAEPTFAKFKSLIAGMYVEANPIPIKWMLYKKGLIRSPELRLPLSTLDQKYEAQLTDLMKGVGYL